MKKLKLNDELLQHAKSLTRENQKKILGGYGGSGGGGGNPCYSIMCWSQSHVLLGIVTASPSSPCGVNYNTDYLACVHAGYNVYSASCGC